MNNLLLITFMVCVTILGVTAIICNRKPQKEVATENVSKPKRPTKPEQEIEPKPKVKPELVLVPSQKPTHEEIEKQTKAYVANGGTIGKPKPSNKTNKRIQPMRQVILRVLSVAEEPMDIESIRAMVNNLDNGAHKHVYANTKRGKTRFSNLIYNLVDVGLVVSEGTGPRNRTVYAITEKGIEYLINKKSVETVKEIKNA